MAPTHQTAASLASTGTTTFLVVAALLVVAVLMVIVAVWVIRATRRDPPALAPLERMGDRSWRNAEPEARAASLVAARPPGAAPPAPMIELEPEPPEEAGPVDAELVDAEPGDAEPVDAEPGPSALDEDEADGEDGPGYARADG